LPARQPRAALLWTVEFVLVRTRQVRPHLEQANEVADVDVVVRSQSDLVFVLGSSCPVLVGAAIADNEITVIVLFGQCRIGDREFLFARLAQAEASEVAALNR
jgi:hypothetical protein